MNSIRALSLFSIIMVNLVFIGCAPPGIFNMVLNEEVFANSLVVAQTSDTWKHDCSNTSGFERLSSWSTITHPDWIITSGDFDSSGTYLEFTNIPSGTDWHGPVYFYDLNTTYSLANLTEFTVQYDVENSQGGDQGAICVFLADSSGRPILITWIADIDGSSSRGEITVEYRTEVNSAYTHGSQNIQFTEFDNSMSLWYNESFGVQGHVPGLDDATLFEASSSEKLRDIKYVVLMGGRYGGESFWTHGRVTEIFLKFHASDNTSTPDGDSLWSIIIPVMLVGIVLLVMAILLCKPESSK